MAELKLAIFDVDGTLIDSIAHIKSAMTRAFEACGRTPPAEQAVRGIVGLSLPQAMRVLDPGLSDGALSDVVEAYKNSFNRSETAEVQQSAPMFDGAREAILRLRRREELLLGVATGKSRRGLRRMIDVHALDGMFETTQVADDHPSKPHPSMVEQALSETGVGTGDAVMIGDTTFDMEMGRSAGVATVGVSWGYHPVDALKAHADIVVDSFAALDTALQDILGIKL